MKLTPIWAGRKKLWVNTRFHTGSVGKAWFDKISLQSQVKFRAFCDISQRVSGCLWTWNSKQNPAAANLNTARQRLRKKCLHELLGRIYWVSPADIWKSESLHTLLFNFNLNKNIREVWWRHSCITLLTYLGEYLWVDCRVPVNTAAHCCSCNYSHWFLEVMQCHPRRLYDSPFSRTTKATKAYFQQSGGNEREVGSSP